MEIDPRITARGRELAHNLAGCIGYTTAITVTCSRIARHAVTLHRISEIECNAAMPWQARDGGHWTPEQEDWIAQRREQLERRVTRLVEDLPCTDDGPFIVRFNGDPRGGAVKISAPGESHHALTGKDWGGEVPV